MSSRSRVLVLGALALVVLTVPSILLAPSGASTAAGLIGLGGLGILLVTAMGGLRWALVGSGALALASGLAVAIGGAVLPGVALMVAVAVLQGLSAHVRLQQAVTTLSITVAFVVAEDPSRSPLDDGLLFGAAMGGYAVIVALVTVALMGPNRSTSTTGDRAVATVPSWSRTWGYGIALALAATVTTAVALSDDWGHTGGWLIMTPFIVMLPDVHDSWRKALNRGAGTVGGFLIASLIAAVFGSGIIVTGFGIGFALLAMYAVVHAWPYAYYALVITPAIVILESIGRPVQKTAQDRLTATLLAVAIALTITALAAAVERFATNRAAAKSP